ncbi:MAG: thiolase family protein [Eggerthellaceae bacterium]|nr:thiolase family protein [Eggerthellaceae bacterium]
MSHFENGNYQVDVKPLKPLARSVSIIGVGATPFMNILKDENFHFLTEGELFGYAALEAMQDAGVTPKDVEYYFHGSATPQFASDYVTPNMQVANWFGMKGKASSSHSEACCTGYVALEQAVNLVASGAYDIVLTGGCETSVSHATPLHPAWMRRESTIEELLPALTMIWSKDYTLPSKAANAMCADAWLDYYAREYNLSHEVIDDVLCAMAKSNRKAAAINPLGGAHETYEEMGAQIGMSADEFLRSKFNPHASEYMRISNFELNVDGAAAAILCPTEMAYQFTDHPIEVLGTGHSCLEGGTARLEKYATAAAYKQIRDLTGLTGADMDLFLTNDFMMPSQLLSAEECEYLPRGEGWKHYLEDNNAYWGDKPINTNGGRCHYGHAHGASGLADVYEAVKQMRGEMGETQVKHPVKYAMLRGFGGGQNVTCSILRNLK